MFCHKELVSLDQKMADSSDDHYDTVDCLEKIEKINMVEKELAVEKATSTVNRRKCETPA